MTKVPNAGQKGRRSVGGELVSPCEILGPTIVELVRAGMRPRAAAQAAGIAPPTLSGWIKRGVAENVRLEKGEEPIAIEAPYKKFVDDLNKAEAESQAGLVVAWFKEARSGDWKAAKEFLSRRWPDEWGGNDTVKVEVSGGIMGQIEHTHEIAPVDDDARKRAVLEALVESGDLPSNVLSAWDGVIDAEVIDDSEGQTDTTYGVEEAVRIDTSSHSTPEAGSISDMGDE